MLSVSDERMYHDDWSRWFAIGSPLAYACAVAVAVSVLWVPLQNNKFQSWVFRTGTYMRDFIVWNESFVMVVHGPIQTQFQKIIYLIFKPKLNSLTFPNNYFHFITNFTLFSYPPTNMDPWKIKLTCVSIHVFEIYINLN
jgi:hypothetical protein